jgi:hypothetical protein
MQPDDTHFFTTWFLSEFFTHGISLGLTLLGERQDTTSKELEVTSSVTRIQWQSQDSHPTCPGIASLVPWALTNGSSVKAVVSTLL